MGKKRLRIANSLEQLLVKEQRQIGQKLNGHVDFWETFTMNHLKVIGKDLVKRKCEGRSSWYRQRRIIYSITFLRI